MEVYPIEVHHIVSQKYRDHFCMHRVTMYFVERDHKIVLLLLATSSLNIYWCSARQLQAQD
jgi:hypothetical protein